jgi:hypothetical protein
LTALIGPSEIVDDDFLKFTADIYNLDRYAQLISDLKDWVLAGYLSISGKTRISFKSGDKMNSRYLMSLFFE